MKQNTLFAAAALLLGLSGASFSAGTALSNIQPVGQPAAALAAVPAPEAVKSQKEAWKHVQFTAADGTGITVDYIAVDQTSSVIASPVWVNVSGKNFNNVGNVRVVLMNYYYFPSGVSPVKLHSTQQIDLKYSGGPRFTGQFQKVLLSEGVYSYGGNMFRQELAVVVDGKWLRDPVSNTNNFKFRMVK